MFVCFFSRNFSQIVLPALRNLGKKHPCRFVVVTSSKNVSIFLGYIYILELWNENQCNDKTVFLQMQEFEHGITICFGSSAK